MDFLVHHALCFAYHLGLLWLWHRAKSKLTELELAFQHALFAPLDRAVKVAASLLGLVVFFGGVWLLFHRKTSFYSN